MSCAKTKIPPTGVYLIVNDCFLKTIFWEIKTREIDEKRESALHNRQEHTFCM